MNLFWSLSVLICFAYALAVELCDTSSADRFEIYKDDNPVCLVYNGTSKMIFFPEVDEFTLLEVSGSFDSFGNVDNEDYVLQIEVGGMSTEAIKYHTSASTIAFYTVIVKLENGKVTDVYWDTDCSACSKDLCVDGFCSIENDDCSSKYDCDIQIYIAWLGTDSDGRYMTSSGKRFSAFTKYSTDGLYDSVLSSANRRDN